LHEFMSGETQMSESDNRLLFYSITIRFKLFV